MAITVVFETHAISEDSELGVASGWSHSRLSDRGRRQARELGERRRDDGIAAVFSSDLRRAVETADIASVPERAPILLDWRLRECDYGERNGDPAEAHGRDRAAFLDEPFPGGESWRQAIARVGRFLEDLPTRWDDTRVLVIGHVATRVGPRSLRGRDSARGPRQRDLRMEARLGVPPRRTRRPLMLFLRVPATGRDEFPPPPSSSGDTVDQERLR